MDASVAAKVGTGWNDHDKGDASGVGGDRSSSRDATASAAAFDTKTSTAGRDDGDDEMVEDVSSARNGSHNSLGRHSSASKRDRQSPPPPSATASYNDASSRRKAEDSDGSSMSISRSKSRSNSPERASHSRAMFERLKADWGKEDWQDFELLQSNVPGPGMKGYSGTSGSQGTGATKSES